MPLTDTPAVSSRPASALGAPGAALLGSLPVLIGASAAEPTVAGAR